MSLVAWSNAAFQDQSSEGTCLLVYVIGPMSSTLNGPRHILQWASKFTRKLAKSSQGREVYALSEMVGHKSLLREFFGPFVETSPCLVGLEDYEGLLARRGNKGAITGENSARYLSGSQLSPGSNAMESVCWPPGTESCADGLNDVKSDMVPLLRMLRRRAFCPGARRPLRGASSREVGRD